MSEPLEREHDAPVEQLRLADGELLVAIRSGVATVTLNRPQVLNALSFGMIRGLRDLLAAWRHDPAVRAIHLEGAGGKAFCAGGDVRAIYDSFARGTHIHEEFFAVEYALDYAIHAYPKPIVANLDGIVMGGGMGISQGASLRLVGARTRMAMPETAIGIFPDVGGSYFLSRTPGCIGAYLALAGPTIGAADALYAGLADRYVDADSGRGPGTSELERLRPAIDRHFAHDRVETIVDSLAGETRAEYREWAAATHAALLARSPTMLKVTLEEIRRGAALAAADCFRMELGLIHGCFGQRDFLEGIRALLIDKDNQPRWRPATLAEVSVQDVERFFAPRWDAAEHPLRFIDSPRNP